VALAFRRLLPVLIVMHVIAYADRVNITFAETELTRDLAISSTVFGLAAGIFFASYVVLEIPSNLMLHRVGARLWMGRIMITWGIVAAATAFVWDGASLVVARVLLGVGEAGFYPGIIVYLTHWFASRDRARALAYFFVATPIAQVISPKLSNILLKIGTDEVVNGVPVHHPEVWGLEGWQWIYIAWGIPAVILGVLVLIYLTDRPQQAKWLTADERDALLAELEREKDARPSSHKMGLGAALSHPRVLLLALIYFLVVTGSYGVEFFMPSILERWYSLKFDALTWLVILPPLLAVFGQLFVGWSSDRKKERWLHTSVPMAAGAAGLLLVTQSKGNLPLTIFGFMLAYAGFQAYLPAFWSLPSLFLSGTSAAGSIGFINSVGNLGGFMGPFVLGTVEKLTGSFMGGLFFLTTCMALSSVTVFWLGRSDIAGSGRGAEDIQPGAPLVKSGKVGAETTP